MFKDNFYLTDFTYTNTEFTSSILNIFDRNRPTSVWDCRVESSHQLDYKPQVPTNLVEVLNNKIAEFSNTKLGSIFRELPITEVWYNVYTYGMYQETHSHEDNAFAGIYFLEFDPSEHTAPLFYNPVFYSSFHSPALKHLEEIVYQPQVNTGTLVIFPGNIPHEVPQQTSHKPRITISFNVSVDLKEYFAEYMRSIK